MKKADLHTHTTYSDGVFLPEELLIKAKSVGLDAISITDHDTVDGYVEALQYSQKYDIEIISGCEFSCFENGREFHILGLNIDPDNQNLKIHLKNFRNARLHRAKQIHKKLSDLGIHFSFDDILETAGKAPVTRPHIAQVLLNKGFIDTARQAFERYIGEGCPAFQNKAVFPVESCINLINKSSGVAVIAHPRNYIDQPTLYKFIQLGLDGIEVYHPSHNADQIRFYQSIASQFWLLETGGSDFHGNREYDTNNFGNFYVNYSVVESIKYITGKK
jgi:hypothetical protein